MRRPWRPARRASAGVAAAVAACSPPRPFDGAQVRIPKGRALREAGLGASRAVRGRVIRGSPARGSPRYSPGEGRSRGLRAGGKTARRGPVVRRYGPRHSARTEIGAEVSLARGAACVKSAGGQRGETGRHVQVLGIKRWGQSPRFLEAAGRGQRERISSP
ncbi:hypothetical protein NDU88_007113 [Pleurodeles waltl]|uniref:Uncharacterized protein n=1 Tax=Pleurodeles waltl TaxID=8319 RepID=A0AAV7SRS8_PLEWA|nr:hypothetical protein NDU88_007113 [Pleurodeles waltl]